ncbi:hypothetical protein CL615_00285 [archaeon]|jgi:hypothetical protein|nr:hypothetical protein [archaeon]MDP6547424.1 hypothetical protein [Candidatus Woesearchaeota archaeon]|tara:strand:- start:20436 stop:21056 length:621 start_codon:yes stop_codon:yes gene_type:complete
MAKEYLKLPEGFDKSKIIQPYTDFGKSLDSTLRENNFHLKNKFLEDDSEIIRLFRTYGFPDSKNDIDYLRCIRSPQTREEYAERGRDEFSYNSKEVSWKNDEYTIKTEALVKRVEDLRCGHEFVVFESPDNLYSVDISGEKNVFDFSIRASEEFILHALRILRDSEDTKLYQQDGVEGFVLERDNMSPKQTERAILELLNFKPSKK